VEHVQHQPAKAREAMDLAGRLSNEHHLLPRYSIWVKSILTRLWIAQEELGKAADLIQQCGIKIDDEEIPYLHEPEYLGLTRLLLAEGNYEAALTLSQRILQKAEATNRMRRVIEVLALQALLFQAKGKTDQALKTLDRALSLAKPEGYIRSFLDEGDQMTRLLHLAKSQGLEKEYVAELLSAAYEIAGAIHSTTQAMSAHLSRREVEVLKLIESGCSNKEIAAKLYISIATVKRHISNIYGKLGAQSRTQAIAAGKELGLFDKTFL
jgi:LuxR family maltose regulon positive regulatory protein